MPAPDEPLRLPANLPRISALELWRPLQLAERSPERGAWLGDHSYRSLSAYGLGSAYRAISSGSVPKGRSTSDTIRQASPFGIGATLHTDEHPTLPCRLAATLTLEAYRPIVDFLGPASAADWDLALADPATPPPFRYQARDDGARSLVRSDDRAITARVLAVLAQLVNRCDTASTPPPRSSCQAGIGACQVQAVARPARGLRNPEPPCTLTMYS